MKTMEEFVDLTLPSYGENGSDNCSPNNDDDIHFICPTCLSKDRDCYYLDGLHKHILFLIGVQIVNAQIICWECYAMIKKIIRFQHTALQAQQLLGCGNMAVVDSIGSLSALKTTDIIKVLSITFADDQNDPKTTVFITRPPALQTIKPKISNSTTEKEKAIVNLVEKSEDRNSFDSDEGLEHDIILVDPLKNDEPTNNKIKAVPEEMDVMYDTNSVVNQNDSTLETTDVVNLDTESTINNEIISDAPQTPSTNILATNQTLATVNTSEPSVCEVKDFTPAVITLEDPLEMNESATASDTLSNSSLVDVRNSKIDDNSAKNSLASNHNITKLETSNSTSLEISEPSLGSLKDVKPAETANEFEFNEINVDENSTSLNQNGKILESSNATFVETDPLLFNVNKSTPFAFPLDGPVVFDQSITKLETSKSSLVNLNTTSITFPHEESKVIDQSVPIEETSIDKLTSLIELFKDVNDSTPAVISHGDSTDTGVATTETSNKTSLEILDQSVVDGKKSNTAEISFKHPVEINQNVTTKLDIESSPKRRKKRCFLAIQRSSVRKRKQAYITTQKTGLSSNMKVSKTGNNTTTQEKKLRIPKSSRLLNKNAKKSKGPEISLDCLIKSIINLTINDSGDDMRNDIPREQTTDAIDDPIIDSIETPLTTDQVNDQVLPVKHNFNTEHQNISIETPSEANSNLSEIDNKCQDNLLCMEDLDNSLEDKDTEIPSTDIATDDSKITIVDQNYDTNTAKELYTENENNRTDPVTQFALNRNITTTTVIFPIIKRNNENIVESAKFENNTIHKKLKCIKPLVINRITADSPIRMNVLENKTIGDSQKSRAPHVQTRTTRTRARTCDYIRKVKEYKSKECQTLNILKTVIIDHCYQRNSRILYNAACNKIYNLTCEKHSNKNLRLIQYNESIIRAIHLQNRKVGKVSDDQLDIGDVENSEHELSKTNSIDQENQHFQDDSPMSESHPATTSKSNSNVILRNVEKPREITLLTDIKVENVNPESGEENEENSPDFDSAAARCKIEQEEIDIKPEPLLGEGDNSVTDSASETNFLERFHCEPALYGYDSVPLNTDTSKLSYYDYLYKPKDSYQNLPRNYIKDLQKDSNNTNNLTNVEGDFELNNITVSFSDPLFFSDQIAELTVEQGDNLKSKNRPNSDNRKNSIDDLLEPLYYTDWTDRTYEHDQQTTETGNITSKFSNRRHTKDTDTQITSIKIDNVDDQPRNPCKKRNIRQIPQSTSETETSEKLNYRKKLRVEPKKATKYDKTINNGTNEANTTQLKETRYEKLFLQPIVKLEKIDIINHSQKNPPNIVTDIKAEPTETIEEFLASNQTNVNEELSDEESYHEFDALIQELSMTKHQSLRKRHKVKKGKANDKEKINYSKTIKSGLDNRKKNLNSKQQDLNKDQRINQQIDENERINEDKIKEYDVVTRKKNINIKHLNTTKADEDNRISHSKNNEYGVVTRKKNNTKLQKINELDEPINNETKDGKLNENKSYESESEREIADTGDSGTVEINNLDRTQHNINVRNNLINDADDLMNETNEDQNVNEKASEDAKINESDSAKRKKTYNTIYNLRRYQDGELQIMKENTINSDKFKNAQFKCFKCVRIFGREQSLLRHIGFSHNMHSGNFQCKICDCRFLTMSRLKNHMPTHARCYVCRWCQNEYLHLDMLTEHVEEIHPAEYEARVKKDKIYTCQICKKDYYCYTSIYLHLRTAHKIESLSQRATLTNHSHSTEKSEQVSQFTIMKYYTTSTDEMGIAKKAELLRRARKNTCQNRKRKSRRRGKILTENSMSLTARNFGIWDYVVNLPDYNSSLIGNSSTLTENDLSLIEKNLSLTENKSSLTENNSSLTENNSSLTENNSSLTENSSLTNLSAGNNSSLIRSNSSGVENDSISTENSSRLAKNIRTVDEFLTENSRLLEKDSILTHNNSSFIENSVLTENKSSFTVAFDITKNNFSLRENNLSLTENNLSLTENNLSLTDNNLSLTENNSSRTVYHSNSTKNNSHVTKHSIIARKSCPICDITFRSTSAYTRHFIKKHGSKE